MESKLHDLFSTAFKDSEPGGSILIKKGERVIYEQHFGIANLDTNEKVTESTLFNTGSISKTFVSNGILILQERQQLSVENKITEFFDDFDSPHIIDDIRIKHLLSHSSGLPDLRRVNEKFEYFLTAKDAGNFEPLKRVHKLHFEPGEKFEYSNPAYNGLALIIEKLTNDKWQKFIVSNIFEPAGMKNSKITDGSYPEKGVAHGYEFKNGKYIESDYGEVPTFAAAGNGGVWSTTKDLATYEKALQEHTFLSKALIQESRTIYKPKNWNDTNDPKLGYGWFISPKNDSKFNIDMIYHTGSQGGFNAFYYYFPSKDLLYVGLFNRPLGKSRAKVNAAFDLFEEFNWFD
ncbi:MAG: serine hydrolase domain-containing protein [Maribacter sp.]|uniref:serine hydrolase domain-containing protein n=1 Tax=Maribacter sp. TaxID=1897614 RepID=UPI0032970F67